MVAAGKGRPGARPVTYLRRLDRANLLNDQGPLQLGAQRGAVVSAAALPGRSAKRNKGRVTGAETGAALRFGDETGRTLQSHA